MSKQTALDRVNQFRAQGTPSAFWPQLRRENIADGLVARLNDANLINQQSTPFCGPSSLLWALVRDDPDAYAQAGIDLYNMGKAKIGKFNVEPSRELRFSPVRGGADPVDWMMLASVRDTDNWFLSPGGWFGLNAAGITRPGTMEDWFRKTGYTDIINITYLAAKPIPVTLAMELQRASELYNQDYKVVLFIDADMLNPDTQDDLISWYPDHWVALASAITDGGIIAYSAPISCQIYTWGRLQSIPINPSKPLRKSDFLHMYYGFIAAKR